MREQCSSGLVVSRASGGTSVSIRAENSMIKSNCANRERFVPRDAWSHSYGRGVMKKAVAEFVGTFALVLIGCGTAVVAGMGTGATSVDETGIALAFGLAVVAMAYGVGPISGCHINPAVSLGVL